MKTLQHLLLALLLPVLLSSCSYYVVSPLNITSNPYIPAPIKEKEAPAKKDSYLSIGFSPGGLNSGGYGQNLFYYGSFRFMQSHALGNFRAGYSGNLMLGAIDAIQQTNYIDTMIRVIPGGNFFSGAAGINASFSYAIPFKKGKGEWRVLGIDAAGFNEFGEYASYRKNYPVNTDDYFNFVDRKKTIWSGGLFTEFTRRGKDDKFIAFKFAFIFNTMPSDWKTDYFNDRDYPHGFTYTQYFGKGNKSGFIQFNFSTVGTAAQFGYLVNLKQFKKSNN